MSQVLKQLITYPAADRNKGPILEVLKQILNTEFSSSTPNQQPPQLKALEIGSATGQHLTHFASQFPNIQFQPSDLYNSLFENIVAFREECGLSNIRDPIVLDLTWSPPDRWPFKSEEKFDLIYCSNVLHISPWSCSVGLFSGAGHWLQPKSGLLIVYGPFAVDGVIRPQSNVDFNQSLQTRNSEWGIRDTRMLNQLANENGLTFLKRFDMPANNNILLFKRN